MAYLARHRALALGAVSALVAVGTVHAVRAVQTTDQPGRPDIAWLAQAVPEGACAITDNPSVLILAGRFAAPPGCSDLVDADGSTLTWAGGRRGYQALSQPQAITDWLGVLRQTDYVVVSQGLVPARNPLGPDSARLSLRPLPSLRLALRVRGLGTAVPVSEAQTSEAQTSEAQTSEAQTSEARTSEARTSEVLRPEFLSGLPFKLDPFQLEAMDALDRGHNVVVAAPTGSGKTVVAEYAVARAI